MSVWCRQSYNFRFTIFVMHASGRECRCGCVCGRATHEIWLHAVIIEQRHAIIASKTVRRWLQASSSAPLAASRKPMGASLQCRATGCKPQTVGDTRPIPRHPLQAASSTLHRTPTIRCLCRLEAAMTDTLAMAASSAMAMTMAMTAPYAIRILPQPRTPRAYVGASHPWPRHSPRPPETNPPPETESVCGSSTGTRNVPQL